MGCISSTKKLGDLKSENFFRAVRLHSEVADQGRSGYLELTPRELIFRTGSNQRVVWALQHLRRYGLNGDVFSFEAGRRCMTGPGIYTFRCQRAEQLYHIFQTYINAVSLVTDDAFTFSERERDHPSHTVGRPENVQNANNYLEPAPLVSTGAAVSVLQRSRVLRDSFSSSPLSLDSPDSVPSLSFATSEVVHIQSPRFPSGLGMYVNTPNTSMSIANSNVYSEYPLPSHVEHNNNLSNASNGVFNTLVRKNLVKHSSLDIPPDEFAPMLTPPSDALHMYANVDSCSLAANNFGFGGKAVMRNMIRDQERCYENLNREEMKLILPKQNLPSSTPGRSHSGIDIPCDPQLRQTKSAGTKAVNYIVLDLDQPRSPTQCSPKLQVGSGLSLTAVDGADGSMKSGSKTESLTDSTHTSLTSTTNPMAVTTATITNVTNTTKQNSGSVEQLEKKEESTLGYSTIDFIKTCALIKSSTHGADFDAEPGNEESRITRHSKCVRKAYSISE
nr:uncharacterized protein LOC106623783 [Bactrocera oleae]XP_014098873.2 uncharacterized protein LOC106623783 [Bactrocera oleae]